MRIYHIEHSPGSGWAPGDGAKMLNERLRQASIPQVSLEPKKAWINKMCKERRPIIFNGEEWGLANEELPETTIS